MLQIGLIGFGESGMRFFRAVVFRAKMIGDVCLKSICDKKFNDDHLFIEYNIRAYNNVQDMIENNMFDIIIVATNEYSHFEVLEKLSHYQDKFIKILIEKPLVGNYEQAEVIKKAYHNNRIYVNFIERYSSVVYKLSSWIHENELKILRASFNWAKNRLYDVRPTIGVISEISHPLDLILMLASIRPNTPSEILQGCYLFSDYSYSGEKVLDTINVNLKIGKNLLINGSSSFLWAKRERKIVLYLGHDNEKAMYTVFLEFDNPYWDIDSCIIKKINNDIIDEKIIVEWYTERDFMDEDLFCINKLYKFVDESINDLNCNINNKLNSDLLQACYLQKIIDSIEDDARKKHYYTCIFGAKKNDVCQKDNIKTAMKLLEGNLQNMKQEDWDTGI
jgi:GFO/IDH/MocA oxidoreductase family protein